MEGKGTDCEEKIVQNSDEKEPPYSCWGGLKKMCGSKLASSLIADLTRFVRRGVLDSADYRNSSSAQREPSSSFKGRFR